LLLSCLSRQHFHLCPGHLEVDLDAHDHFFASMAVPLTGLVLLLRLSLQHFHLGPNYLEVDLDVHNYAFLARKALWSYNDRIATVVWDMGFVIQVGAIWVWSAVTGLTCRLACRLVTLSHLKASVSQSCMLQFCHLLAQCVIMMMRGGAAWPVNQHQRPTASA
jgi:hypothetical protein